MVVRISYSNTLIVQLLSHEQCKEAEWWECETIRKRKAGLVRPITQVLSTACPWNRNKSQPARYQEIANLNLIIVTLSSVAVSSITL